MYTSDQPRWCRWKKNAALLSSSPSRPANGAAENFSSDGAYVKRHTFTSGVIFARFWWRHLLIRMPNAIYVQFVLCALTFELWTVACLTDANRVKQNHEELDSFPLGRLVVSWTVKKRLSDRKYLLKTIKGAITGIKKSKKESTQQPALPIVFHNIHSNAMWKHAILLGAERARGGWWCLYRLPQTFSLRDVAWPSVRNAPRTIPCSWDFRFQRKRRGPPRWARLARRRYERKASSCYGHAGHSRSILRASYHQAQQSLRLGRIIQGHESTTTL